MTESGAQGVFLDPDEIHLSRYANRYEQAFLSQDFKELCEQIEVTGGNVQPVGVVRREGGRLRLVFGHRRHRACKQLGLKVRAIEIPGPIPETLLLKYMHAENAARKDLTVYEQGCWYASALDDKVYATTAELAQEFGITEVWVAKALQVARLPEYVIKAFPNPLEITSKMGADLAKALKEDSDAVCYRALELQEHQGAGLTANEVFTRLMFEGGESRAEKPRPLSLGGKAKPYGKMGRDAKGRLRIILSADFGFDDRRKLEAIFAEFAKGKEQFLPPVKKSRKSKKPSVVIHAAGGYQGADFSAEMLA